MPSRNSHSCFQWWMSSIKGIRKYKCVHFLYLRFGGKERTELLITASLSKKCLRRNCILRYLLNDALSHCNRTPCLWCQRKRAKAKQTTRQAGNECLTQRGNLSHEKKGVYKQKFCKLFWFLNTLWTKSWAE